METDLFVKIGFGILGGLLFLVAVFFGLRIYHLAIDINKRIQEKKKK